MSKPTILIVDDILENLQVLGSTLFDKGYEIAIAENATSALNILTDITPDLILLDIMMPEIDGFELCKQIKSTNELKEIPIIFLTAKSDTDNIIKGFEYGAVDYITKPFNQNELLSRVHSHIELQQSKKRIEEYNNQLKVLLQKKDEFLGIAAHDMKNPINAILGFANLISNEIDKLNLRKDDKLIISNYIEKIKQTSSYMSRTITSMLNKETLDKGIVSLNISKTNVGQLINSVIESFVPVANSKGIKILANHFVDIYAEVDEDRFQEIIENLISNAIKYTNLNTVIKICLAKRIENSQYFLHFSVADKGDGLDAEDISNAFQKFKKLSTTPTGDENSTGLGLSIVKKLVELHQGTIRIESEKGKGAKFILEIPLNKKYSKNYDNLNNISFIEVNSIYGTSQTNKVETILNNIKNEIVDLETSLLNDASITKINDELNRQWEVVKKSSIINDIRNFALSLKKVGLDNNIRPLETYGNEINTITMTFDLDNLDPILNLYPKIIELLMNKLNHS